MPCQRCSTKLAPGRTQYCKPCSRNKRRETRLPDGGNDVYHKASSPAASNIAQHIKGIRKHFSVPEDASDLRTLSDFTNAVRNHELTQREVIEELHALQEEYQGRFPQQTVDDIQYDPVCFNVRHALQWAESYPHDPTTNSGAVVTDPDGSPDHPEVTNR